MTAQEVALFTVVICTRDRGAHLKQTLLALEQQARRDHDVVVVDQSVAEDVELAARAKRDPGLRVLRDHGVGLSRARNLAWREVEAEWLVYLDDDCRPGAGWSAALASVLSRAGDVQVVSGHVAGSRPPGPGEYLEVTTFPVHTEEIRTGRWTKPWMVGFGVCMAVRRETIIRLGGWDERLGVGSTEGFGAAEDMDFNYRFTRARGRALVTPEVRASHEQWRPADELAPLFHRYMVGWSAFAMKHLRTGDVLGGTWLWGLGALDAGRMAASAVRRRSRLRGLVALAKLRGLLRGTAQGIGYPW